MLVQSKENKNSVQACLGREGLGCVTPDEHNSDKSWTTTNLSSIQHKLRACASGMQTWEDPKHRDAALDNLTVHSCCTCLL